MFSCIEYCMKMIAYFGTLLDVAGGDSQEDNALFQCSSSCGEHLTCSSRFISELFFTWQASRRKIMLYFAAFLHVASISQEDNALFRRSSSCGKHLAGR